MFNGKIISNKGMMIFPFHKVSPLLVPKMCDQHGTSAQSVRAFHYFRTIPLQPISKVDVYKINYKYTALVTRHYWVCNFKVDLN